MIASEEFFPHPDPQSIEARITSCEDSDVMRGYFSIVIPAGEYLQEKVYTFNRAQTPHAKFLDYDYSHMQHADAAIQLRADGIIDNLPLIEEIKAKATLVSHLGNELLVRSLVPDDVAVRIRAVRAEPRGKPVLHRLGTTIGIEEIERILDDVRKTDSPWAIGLYMDRLPTDAINETYPLEQIFDTSGKAEAYRILKTHVGFLGKIAAVGIGLPDKPHFVCFQDGNGKWQLKTYDLGTLKRPTGGAWNFVETYYDQITKPYLEKAFDFYTVLLSMPRTEEIGSWLRALTEFIEKLPTYPQPIVGDELKSVEYASLFSILDTRVLPGGRPEMVSDTLRHYRNNMNVPRRLLKEWEDITLYIKVGFPIVDILKKYEAALERFQRGER